MRSSLINALADRLGTSPAEARAALDDLLQHTRAELKQNRPVHLPGLGTFRTAIHDDRDGRSLTFDPAPALSDAVNASYVGLDTLALTPAQPHLAFSGAPAEESPAEASPAEEEAVAAPADRDQPGPEAGDSLAAEDAAPKDVAKRTRSSKPVRNETAPDRPSTDEPRTAKKSQNEQTAPSTFSPSSRDRAPREEAPQKKPAGSGAARSASRDDAPSRDAPAPRVAATTDDEAPSSRNALPWLIATVLLVAIGVSAWLLSRSPEPVAPTDATAQVEEPTASEEPAAQDAAPQDAAPNQTAGGEADAPAADAPALDEPAAGESTADEPAVPQAPALDPAEGGWTLVVSSDPTRDEAQAVAEEFAQRFQGQDAPIGVIPGDVEGTTYYRVGVGQFASTDEGLRALNAEDSRYPEDAWLLQLSDDS